MFHAFEQCIFAGATRVGGGTIQVRRSHDDGVPEMYADKALTTPIDDGNLLTDADGWGRCWMPEGEYILHLNYGQFSTEIYFQHIAAGHLGIKRKLLTPYDYGAIPGVTKDYSEAIQRAANAARDSWNAANGTWDAVFDWDGQIYRADQSIDYGGVGQPQMRIQNGLLYSCAVGQIALDMGYANGALIHDFKVVGDEQYSPDWGLYYGRAREFSEDGDEDDEGRFKGTGGTCFTGDSGGEGYFARGAALAFAAEVCTWGSGVKWSNKHRDRRAVTVCHASSMLQVHKRFGSDTVSQFRKIPDSNGGSEDASRHSNICHGWGSVEILRPADVQMSLESVSLANPAVARVKSGQLVSQRIHEGMEIFISSGDCPEIEHKSFIVRNMDTAASTFELYRWVKDANDRETAVEEPVDATGFTPYTKGATIQNRTGSALAISGARILTCLSAYLTAFGAPAVVMETGSGSSCDEWIFQFQAERHCDKTFTFDQPDGSVTCSHLKLHTAQISQQAHTAVVWCEGDGQVKLENFGLRITNMAFAPSRGAIAPRRNFRLVDAEVHVPKEEACPTYKLGNGDEWVSISGRFSAYNRNPSCVQRGGIYQDISRIEFGQSYGELEGKGIRIPDGRLFTKLREDLGEQSIQVTRGATPNDLANAKSILNTTHKYPGAMAWVSTDGAPAFATAGQAEARWRRFADLLGDAVADMMPEARERVLGGAAALTFGGAAPDGQSGVVTVRRRNRMIHVDGWVQLDAAFAETGQARIMSGLFHVPAGIAGAAVIGRITGMSGLTGPVTGTIGAQGIELEMYGETGTAALTEANFASGSRIWFSAEWDCGSADDGWTVSRYGQAIMIADAPDVLPPVIAPGSRSFEIIG